MEKREKRSDVSNGTLAMPEPLLHLIGESDAAIGGFCEMSEDEVRLTLSEAREAVEPKELRALVRAIEKRDRGALL